MSKKKFFSSFSGKGYYIALILCAAAIGITGYLYYRNANSNEPTPNTPVSATDPDSHISASATTPNGVPVPSTPDPTDGKKPGKITRPVSGNTVMEYAMEVLSYNPTTRDWRVHNGIDIAAEAGTAVCSAADGTVYTVYEDETMGTTVVIRHEGGYITKYSSLKDVSVNAGDAVASGQSIGTVGCTALLETAIGDHVHFSVTCDGQVIDPETFLQGA